MKNLNFFKVSKSNMSKMDFNVLTFRNNGKPIVYHLLRLIYAIGGLPTRWRALSILFFLKRINLLRKHSGLKGVVIYLKACTVLVQQIIAGHHISDTRDLKCRISRTRSGIPRLISVYWRKRIRAGDTWAIKFILTLTNLYRVLSFNGNCDIKTITDPYSGTATCDDFTPHLKRFILLFTKSDNLILKATAPFQILTSSPSSGYRGYSSRLDSLFKSLYTMKFFNESVERSWFYLAVFCKMNILRTLYSRTSNIIDRAKTRFKGISTILYDYIPPKEQNENLFLGRLCHKVEPAGKVRVFAMVDPWTQWVLKPLHNWLFKILSKHQMDGTFNQLKPLKSVPFGKVPISSLDLSAATDRLPIWLQQMLLSKIFGEKFAYHWYNLLINRSYAISIGVLLFSKPKDISSDQYVNGVRYSVGQPMGALSSWAMLALTHHFIVQHAAWETGHNLNKLFKSYAILGDDIVIWNHDVSEKYQSIMASLGVKLGLAKSVLSPEGLGLEFAKRTLYMGSDVSPIPIKEAMAAHRNMSSALEFQRKYSMKPLALIRFLGYGHKVTLHSNSSKMKTFKMIFTLPSTGEGLLQAIISQKLIFLTENYLELRLQRRLFIRLLIHTVNDLIIVISNDLTLIHQFNLRSSLYSGYHHENDEFHGIKWTIVQSQSERAFNTLTGVIPKLKAIKASLSWMADYVNSSNYLIPPLNPDDFWDNRSKILRRYSIQLYLLEKEFRSVSVSSILNPKAFVPTSKVLTFESKQTLRSWNKWIRYLSIKEKYNKTNQF